MNKYIWYVKCTKGFIRSISLTDTTTRQPQRYNVGDSMFGPFALYLWLSVLAERSFPILLTLLDCSKMLLTLKLLCYDNLRLKLTNYFHLKSLMEIEFFYSSNYLSLNVIAYFIPRP